ncbi:hypothetical protein I3843_01G000800, partial [Carya illinoinensis]
HISLFRSQAQKALQFSLPRKRHYSSAERKNMSGATCIDIILAILLPPLGVFLRFGCKVEFWICLLLTILGYIPGIIYAVYAITK